MIFSTKISWWLRRKKKQQHSSHQTMKSRQGSEPIPRAELSQVTGAPVVEEECVAPCVGGWSSGHPAQLRRIRKPILPHLEKHKEGSILNWTTMKRNLHTGTYLYSSHLSSTLDNRVCDQKFPQHKYFLV